VRLNAIPTGLKQLEAEIRSSAQYYFAQRKVLRTSELTATTSLIAVAQKIAPRSLGLGKPDCWGPLPSGRITAGDNNDFVALDNVRLINRQTWRPKRYLRRLSIPTPVHGYVQIGVASQAKLHIKRGCMRWEENSGFDGIAVAPSIGICAVVVLSEPMHRISRCPPDRTRKHTSLQPAFHL
jgi:hypothetical protein